MNLGHIPMHSSPVSLIPQAYPEIAAFLAPRLFRIDKYMSTYREKCEMYMASQVRSRAAGSALPRRYTERVQWNRIGV